MAATYSSLVGLAVGGKYEIRRVLGAGGMGVVCEAVHLDLGKRVAVKLIDKTMKESELIVARFRREARAAGQINSEHIVDVFDVGADARVGLYMVMEHLSGEDLQGRLERDKKIDVKTGVMIAHQVARGLAKAHEAGVIHRDLKPANVYLTERDNGQMLVKLLDFGVSKLLLEAPGSARITGSGTPIGTPLYMSPEQAEGKDDVDGRADIWSLGAVMYEALAGTPPFADRGSYHGTIVGILTSRPKLLHDAAPWVPMELAKVVDAMLVHDRDARIPNAAAVTQRLLDAFPTVLPDGTGKHTAVIVSQGTAAVDGTGDTEVFTAASFAAASRRASNAPNTGPPAQLAASPSPSHRASNAPSSQQDSTKTVPDATSSPGTPSSDATRTGTATPVGISESKSSGGPKTAPLPPDSFSGGQRGSSPSGVPLTPRASANPSSHPHPSSNPHPSSSAGGVAMPATPPVIEPLPVSELAPTTERDDKLAVRAERRRVVTLASIALAIVGVAIGGYLAGRRGVAPDTATAPPPVMTSAPATQPTTQPTPTTTQAAPASTSINDLPPAAASTGAAPAPAPTTKPLRRRALPKKPAESGSATAPTPYDEPPPSTPSSPTE